MTSDDINSFLSAKTNTEDFKKIIDEDVENYVNLQKKVGSSIHLNFQDTKEINLNNVKLKRLLEETFEGNLTSTHLAYLCDCLTLAENINFESEHIKEVIFSIADPEINGGYMSTKEIEEILNSLG